MKHLTRWSGAAALATALALGVSGTASAYRVVTDTGSHGDVSLVDTQASPAGVCGYQFAGSSGGVNTYVFSSMKVRAPQVYAADRSTGSRDSRMVSWRFQLLEYPPNSPGFYNVAQSRQQKARAYEDAPAPFTAQTVQFNGSQENSYLVRVVIKWFKNDGSVEGRVDLMLDWFKVKGTGPVTEDNCYGAYQTA